MNPTAAVLGVCGAGVGLGLVLIIAGWRGDPLLGERRRTRRRQLTLASRDGRLRLAAAIGAGLITAVVTGWVAGGLLAGVAAAALPGLLGPDGRAAQRTARVEAVASWTEMLRDTLAAAAGLEQTILASATTAPAALQPEVHDLAARLERGERLPAALRVFAERVADPTCDLVVSALTLASEHQARQLADLLGELAGEAREQVAMRLRIDAGRARTRTTVRVIVGTTVAFAVGLVLLNRTYLHPYDTPTGQLVLLTVGGLFGLAFWWLARIGQVGEGDRVLAKTSHVEDTIRREVGV
jgi:Flp pilus assembly protein TadB